MHPPRLTPHHAELGAVVDQLLTGVQIARPARGETDSRLLVGLEQLKCAGPEKREGREPHPWPAGQRQHHGRHAAGGERRDALAPPPGDALGTDVGDAPAGARLGRHGA